MQVRGFDTGEFETSSLELRLMLEIVGMGAGEDSGFFGPQASYFPSFL